MSEHKVYSVEAFISIKHSLLISASNEAEARELYRDILKKEYEDHDFATFDILINVKE